MKKINFKLLTLQGDGHHIIVEVHLLDRSFHMVIDTGASKTVLDRTMLQEAGISEEEFINTDIKSSGLGTNDMQSFMLKLPYLKIADWQINNFQVAVLDLSSINYAYSQLNFKPVIGVLGGDILYKYGAIINYKESSIQLNERAIKKRLPK